MSETLTKTFADQSPNQSSAVADIRAIIADAPDAKAIVSAFGGPGRLALTLQALEAVDNAHPEVGNYIFDHRADEKGPFAMHRLAVLTRQADEGNRPSFPAIARAWLDRMGIDRDSNPAKVLLLTAARAEMVHGLPPASAKPANDEPAYHNRTHFLQVFQTVSYLLEAQRSLQNKETSVSDPLLKARLSDDEVATTMIAAMAHDIDHPGRGNPKGADQKQVSFFNEDAAAAAVYPLIDGVYGKQGAGELYRTVETYIRYTDPGTPRNDLSRTLQSVRSGQSVEASPDYYTPDSVNFWAGAAMLSDADILLSAAAGANVSRENSAKLTQEAKSAGLSLDFTTLASRKFFFDNIVGKDGFQSAPARILFNPVYSLMYQKTEAALAPKPV